MTCIFKRLVLSAVLLVAPVTILAAESDSTAAAQAVSAVDLSVLQGKSESEVADIVAKWVEASQDGNEIASIIKQVVAQYPNYAGAIVGAAAYAQPSSVTVITRAAITAAPTQAASIVAAAVTSAPTQAYSIVSVAVTAAPDQRDVILTAAASQSDLTQEQLDSIGTETGDQPSAN